VQVGNVKVETHGSWRKEKSLKVLASAILHLTRYPEITSENLVVVPENLRSQAEFALEATANLICIIERSKRLISSPTPCVAFGLFSSNQTYDLWSGVMEQAAYEVLFNKEVWRDSASRRREGVRLTSGTTSARSADVFVVRGTGTQFCVQLLDPFGRYPRDLEGFLTTVPGDWWCVDPEAMKDKSGRVSLSALGAKFEVREG